MADVMSKISLFSPCSHLCMYVNPKKSSSVVEFPSLNLKSLTASSRSGLYGQKIGIQNWKETPMRGNSQDLRLQMSLCIGKAMKWWEKGLQQNMKEIACAQDLVDSLLSAGNKLVIVDFFSPGCGGCKALYPKICQFAEMNPDIQFLQVNYEEHKSMCYSLNVHVLPFFRFYRGAQGRLCSFSCTNATIKKFKDALAKYATNSWSLEPAKGLEESELMALAANKDLSFNYTRKLVAVPEPEPAGIAAVNPELPLPSFSKSIKEVVEEKALVAAWR